MTDPIDGPTTLSPARIRFALLALALGGFGIGSTEFVAMGLLPNIAADLLPLRYDHQGLSAEMRRERLPEEFVATILTGWWTTCLEILPARERAASRF